MAYVNIVRRWLMSMEYIDVDHLLAGREECRYAKIRPVNLRTHVARHLSQPDLERFSPLSSNSEGAQKIQRWTAAQ